MTLDDVTQDGLRNFYSAAKSVSYFSIAKLNKFEFSRSKIRLKHSKSKSDNLEPRDLAGPQF